MLNTLAHEKKQNLETPDPSPGSSWPLWCALGRVSGRSGLGSRVWAPGSCRRRRGAGTAPCTGASLSCSPLGGGHWEVEREYEVVWGIVFWMFSVNFIHVNHQMMMMMSLPDCTVQQFICAPHVSLGEVFTSRPFQQQHSCRPWKAAATNWDCISGRINLASVYEAQKHETMPVRLKLKHYKRSWHYLEY